MNEKSMEIVKDILEKRFKKDSIIAIATAIDGMPHVRNVDGFYENGCFYVITSLKSSKMKQILINPNVAISGEWFTAHWIGENIGWIKNEENTTIAQNLREAFASWYGNGHINEENPNNIILRIKLTDGILFADGTKYKIDFINETVE